MKKFIILVFSVFSLLFSAQKKNFISNESLIKAIIPNPKVNSWVLVYNEYAKDRVLKQAGEKINYLPQFSGFKLNNNEDHFFYIAYMDGGNISYIKDLDALKTFIGNLNNGEEAALVALSKGYFVDFEFKNYAASYEDLGDQFVLEAAKITSTECPIAKSHFLITLNKKTGAIISEKELGVYNEVYQKDCKNNPHYDDLKKQMEEAKQKQLEQKEIQKKMTEKMRKKLEKNRRKD